MKEKEDEIQVKGIEWVNYAEWLVQQEWTKMMERRILPFRMFPD